MIRKRSIAFDAVNSMRNENSSALIFKVRRIESWTFVLLVIFKLATARPVGRVFTEDFHQAFWLDLYDYGLSRFQDLYTLRAVSHVFSGKLAVYSLYAK